MFRNEKKYARENQYIVDQLKANPSLENFEKIHKTLGITPSQLMNRYVVLRSKIASCLDLGVPVLTTNPPKHGPPIFLDNAIIRELNERNPQYRIENMLLRLTVNKPKNTLGVHVGIYQRDLLIMALMRFSPLRSSELVSLKTSEIVKNENRWMVNVTFRKKIRSVLLPLDVSTYLEKYMLVRNCLLLEGQTDPGWFLLTAKERVIPAKKLCEIHLEQIILKKTIFNLDDSHGFGLTGYKAIFIVSELKKRDSLEGLIHLGHVLGLSFQSIMAIYIFLKSYVYITPHNPLIKGV